MAGSVFEPLPRNSTRVARPDTRASSCRTSWIWHPSLRGYGRRAACGRASRTSPWLSFQFHEDGGPSRWRPGPRGSTLKEMHRARYLGNNTWTEAWGISWYAVRKEELIWVQHSGGLHGFSSNVCFDPKERVGAIALLNGDGDAADLAMALGAVARGVGPIGPSGDRAPHADAAGVPLRSSVSTLRSSSENWSGGMARWSAHCR